MDLSIKPSKWVDDELGEVSGIVIRGSFVDMEAQLDLDERVGLETLVVIPELPEESEDPRLKKQLRLARDRRQKADHQRAYMARQEQVRLAIEAFIDKAIDERPEIDLTQFAPGQSMELNKNRKTRKVSFARRYRSL